MLAGRRHVRFCGMSCDLGDLAGGSIVAPGRTHLVLPRPTTPRRRGGRGPLAARETGRGRGTKVGSDFRMANALDLGATCGERNPRVRYKLSESR